MSRIEILDGKNWKEFLSSDSNFDYSVINCDALNMKVLEDESIKIEDVVPGFSIKGILQKPIKGSYNARKCPNNRK